MQKHKWFFVMITGLIVILITGTYVKAVSTSTTYITMFVDKMDATVDNEKVTLETAPILLNDAPFVPAKFTGEALGIKVEWNPKIKMVEMFTPRVKIQLDIDHQLVIINKVSAPFDNIAVMNNGTLMVKLSWLADYMGAKYYYSPDVKRIELVYVKRPDEIYNNASDSSMPVAKFTFAKASYRVGEPVKYVDLSYDPDAEGIAKYEWTGNQEVFFQPGQFPVTLKVKDAKGLESKVYTRKIIIEPNNYLNEIQYKLNFQQVGTYFKTDWSMIWGNFWDLPLLKKEVVEDRSRKLIVSDSPETIKEKGILYQEKVNGKARLYADHVNGTADKVQFTIMARNLTGKAVNIKTTNKGEVYPSIYANLIGHEASVDFMLHDPLETNLVVPSGQSFVYIQMPDFYPGQGVNVFYDVETDGDVEFSFVAMDNISTPSSLGFYKSLDFAGNVRGTFPVADKTWNVDMTSLTKPSRLTIGDGSDDTFIKGYDVQRKAEVLNEGNYGMIYKIHANKPRKMVVLLIAKGGPFKGPFKINGEFMMAPASGVINAFESVQVMARTTGKEEAFDMEFTPPAGSAFPIDLIFYPLEDLK